MRRSATSNHNEVSATVPFKDAARAVCRTWRKKHRPLPCPPLSHALSTLDNGGRWLILSAETGEVVAEVQDGSAVLAENEIVERSPGKKCSAQCSKLSP